MTNHSNEINLSSNNVSIDADKDHGDLLQLLESSSTEKEKTAKRPTVSVIIPTLNEGKNLPYILPFLPMNWIDEVILVDGRSTDDTVEVAKKLLPSIKIVLETARGKGAAMKAGYRESTGDILIVLDADGSNDPREIPRYITPLLEGADFVKGSRFAPGAGTTDMPRIRMLGNGAFVLISNLLFNVKFTDLCYGYHAFWRYCLNEISLEKFDGFEIDTAIYLHAVRAKLRVVEVPSFEGYRFFGVGKLQTIPDGFRVLNTIFLQYLGLLRDGNKNLEVGFKGIKYARPQVFVDQKPGDVTLVKRLTEFIQLLSIMSFTGKDTSGVMQRVLKLALDSVGADSGSLILLDENGEFISGCLASEGDFHAPDDAAWSAVLSEGLAGWAIKNQKPVLVLDTKADPRWLQRDWEKSRRSAISLPLLVGGMVIGALTVIRSDEERFTKDEMEWLHKHTLKVS